MWIEAPGDLVKGETTENKREKGRNTKRDQIKSALLYFVSSLLLFTQCGLKFAVVP